MLFCFEAYTNYKKSSFKSAKLEPLSLPLGNLVPFLEKHCEGVAPSLRQVWTKTQFYMHSKEVGSSSKAFEMMLEAGLHSLLQEIGDASSLELWFRTMVFEAWANYLQDPVAEDDMSDRVLRLKTDAMNFRNSLLEHDLGAATQVFRLVADDLWCFATLLGCWQPDTVNVSEVDKASEMLKGKRMASIQKVLGECSLGKHLLSKAALILQTSGQAIAADAKLARALGLLTTEQMPVICDDGALRVLKGRELVTEMKVVGIFDESLDLLEDAIEMVSRKEHGGCSARVIQWVSAVVDQLHMAEECLILDLMLLLQETGVAPLIMMDSADMGTWNQGEACRCFAELRNKFHTGGSPCDDTPLTDFIQRLSGFLETAPVELIDKETAEATITTHISPVVNSAQARHALDGVLRLMGDILGTSDVSSIGFCEELKRCISESDLQNSRLSKVVKLQGAVEAMGDAPILETTLKDVRYQISADPDLEDPSANTAVWIDFAVQVIDSLPRMAVLPHLEGEVAQALQTILKEIVAGTCLASLKMPSDMPTGDAPGKYLDACMKCSSPIGKPVESWLKSEDDRSWPSTLPTKVACDILTVMAARGKHVGVSPMCTTGSEDNETKVTDLEALEHALRVLDVVGRIGRCFAWVKTNYFGLQPLCSMAVKGSIGVNLDKVLTVTAKHLQDVSLLLSSGAAAAITRLEVMPWFSHCSD